MSDEKVEIQFNAKSSGQGVVEAMKIAEKYEKSFAGKICSVRFSSLEDENFQKILDAVDSLKYTKVFVDQVEYDPREVKYTLYCGKKLLCKGVCGHIRFGFGSLEDFLIQWKPRIKKNQIIANEYTIRDIHDFLEPQGEDRFTLNKNFVRKYISEKLKFESHFCSKYDEKKMEAAIDQLPDKVILQARGEIRVPTVIRPRISPPRPAKPVRIHETSTRDLVKTFYSAQVMGAVVEHSLRKVLSEVYPEKVTQSTEPLDPEKLIRETVFIPDEKLSDLYSSLAEFAPQDKQLAYSRKAFELDKKFMGDSSDLAESYYWYVEILKDNDLLDEAMQILSEGIKKFEGDPYMYELLLRIHVKKKEYTKALKVLDQILALDSNWLDINAEEDLAPLRKLPEFEVIMKKYQSNSNDGD